MRRYPAGLKKRVHRGTVRKRRKGNSDRWIHQEAQSIKAASLFVRMSDLWRAIMNVPDQRQKSAAGTIPQILL